MAETISGYTILSAPWARRALIGYQDEWFQGYGRKTGSWTMEFQDGTARPVVYCLFDRGIQGDAAARSIAVEYDLATEIIPGLIGTIPPEWTSMSLDDLREEARDRQTMEIEAMAAQAEESFTDLPGTEDAPTKREVLDAIRSGGEFVGEVGGTVADAAGSVFGSALGGALKGFLKSNPWIIPAVALYAVVKLA